MFKNNEEVVQFYNKIEQYCIVAHGGEPDKITIYSDGEIYAIYTQYHSDEDSYLITLENLSEDLDELAKKRKEKEEAERIKREEKEKIYKKEKEKQEKAERKAQYLKLKKEFES